MAFTYDTATRCGLLKYDAPTSNIITKPGTTIYVVQSGRVDNGECVEGAGPVCTQMCDVVS
jgi:hypothetical protein